MTELKGFLHADWPCPPRVHALTTFRHFDPEKDFNLALYAGGSPQLAQLNRVRLYCELKVQPLPWLNQVHGHQVVSLPHSLQNPQADGSWTNQPEQVCVVLTADCLPVVLCDAKGRVVSALHGGWRSLAGGILAQGVQAMRTSTQEPILAWLGPAIGPKVYEVGYEVFEAFGTDFSSCFAPQKHKPNHYLMNIYQIAKQQLKALGVTDVYGGTHCTYSEDHNFYSYRRDKSCGRMATLIWTSLQVF